MDPNSHCCTCMNAHCTTQEDFKLDVWDFPSFGMDPLSLFEFPSLRCTSFPVSNLPPSHFESFPVWRLRVSQFDTWEFPSLTSHLKFILEYPSLRVSQFHSFPVSLSEPLLHTNSFPVPQLLHTNSFPVLTVSQFPETGKVKATKLKLGNCNRHLG